MRTRLFTLGLLGAAALYAACSAGDAGSTIGEEGGGGDGSTTTTGNTGGSTSTGEGGIDFSGSGGHQGGGFPCDDTVTDFDQDGFSTAEGDCNDCDPNVNPGAVEVQTDPMTNPDMIDEDCDGEIDEVIPTCDAGIFFDEIDAMKAAQTIELCDVATPGGKDYGVLQAFWGHANGAQAVPAQQPQFGMQADFGPNVQTQAGDRMLVLSSGHARLPTQANAATNNSANPQGFTPLVPPAGFPQNVPGCDGGTDIYDDIALNLRLRAPTNATGFKYRFKFYSFEFAEYVCTNFNDQYIALVNPPPMGSLNGNISFDSNNNPVSVNLAFFDVCDPVANNDFAAYCLTGCPAQPNPYCPLGPAELAGNGFDDAFGSNFEDAGGTSWLETTAPIDGGSEFDIRFAIWDTGDSAYDSSVLIDGFQWVATPGTQIGTVPPPPQ